MNGLEIKSVDFLLAYFGEETDWKERSTAGTSVAAEVKANVLM